MKTVRKILLLGLLVQFCFPLNSRSPQERENVTITDPAEPNLNAVTLQIDPSPKFVFSFYMAGIRAVDETIRIRKTDNAVMYEYKPKKPDKPYRHLMIFLELLGQETKTKPPRVEIVVVTAREFLDIVEINGLVWREPLIDTSALAKPKGSGLLWFLEGDTFRVFMVNFKDSARVLVLEQFITHLTGIPSQLAQ